MLGLSLNHVVILKLVVRLSILDLRKLLLWSCIAKLPLILFCRNIAVSGKQYSVSRSELNKCEFDDSTFHHTADPSKIECMASCAFYVRAAPFLIH